MVQGFIVLLLLVSTSFPVAAENAGLSEISRLIESNRLSDARKELDNFLDKNENDPRALLMLSSVQLKESQVSQALQTLTNQEQRLKRFPTYYNNLAYAYFYKGKDKLAIATLQKGLQQDPDYNILYENLSTIYAFMAKKAYENAIENSNKIQQVLPKLKLTNQTQTSSPSPNAIIKNIPEMADLNKEKQHIEEVLQSWAKAWSGQESKRYLDAYSPKFVTPNGVDFSSWRQYREERVRSPRFIEVKLSNMDIVIAKDASMASVHFLQHYRSNTLNDKVMKQVVLQKEMQNWMIISENVAN